MLKERKKKNTKKEKVKRERKDILFKFKLEWQKENVKLYL